MWILIGIIVIALYVFAFGALKLAKRADEQMERDLSGRDLTEGESV